MVTAYIGLGSNLGNCRLNLLQAWDRLGEVGGVRLLALSSPYRTAPVGMASENWFINAVGSLETTLQAGELLAEMFAVEAALGRRRTMQGQPEDRTVDLDLLYWGNRVCHEPGVILPHPEIANRLFVLLPLAEIGPEQRHPVFNKTSLEMLHEYMAKKGEMGPGSEILKTSWIDESTEVPA